MDRVSRLTGTWHEPRECLCAGRGTCVRCLDKAADSSDEGVSIHTLSTATTPDGQLLCEHCTCALVSCKDCITSGIVASQPSVIVQDPASDGCKQEEDEESSSSEECLTVREVHPRPPEEKVYQACPTICIDKTHKTPHPVITADQDDVLCAHDKPVIRLSLRKPPHWKWELTASSSSSSSSVCLPVIQLLDERGHVLVDTEEQRGASSFKYSSQCRRGSGPVKRHSSDISACRRRQQQGPPTSVHKSPTDTALSVRRKARDGRCAPDDGHASRTRNSSTNNNINKHDSMPASDRQGRKQASPDKDRLRKSKSLNVPLARDAAAKEGDIPVLLPSGDSFRKSRTCSLGRLRGLRDNTRYCHNTVIGSVEIIEVENKPSSPLSPASSDNRQDDDNDPSAVSMTNTSPETTAHGKTSSGMVDSGQESWKRTMTTTMKGTHVQEEIEAGKVKKCRSLEINKSSAGKCHGYDNEKHVTVKKSRSWGIPGYSDRRQLGLFLDTSVCQRECARQDSSEDTTYLPKFSGYYETNPWKPIDRHVMVRTPSRSSCDHDSDKSRTQYLSVADQDLLSSRRGSGCSLKRRDSFRHSKSPQVSRQSSREDTLDDAGMMHHSRSNQELSRTTRSCKENIRKSRSLHMTCDDHKSMTKRRKELVDDDYTSNCRRASACSLKRVNSIRKSGSYSGTRGTYRTDTDTQKQCAYTNNNARETPKASRDDDSHVTSQNSEQKGCGHLYVPHVPQSSDKPKGYGHLYVAQIPEPSCHVSVPRDGRTTTAAQCHPSEAVIKRSIPVIKVQQQVITDIARPTGQRARVNAQTDGHRQVPTASGRAHDATNVSSVDDPSQVSHTTSVCSSHGETNVTSDYYSNTLTDDSRRNTHAQHGHKEAAGDDHQAHDTARHLYHHVQSSAMMIESRKPSSTSQAPHDSGCSQQSELTDHTSLITVTNHACTPSDSNVNTHSASRTPVHTKQLERRRRRRRRRRRSESRSPALVTGNQTTDASSNDMFTSDSSAASHRPFALTTKHSDTSDAQATLTAATVSDKRSGMHGVRQSSTSPTTPTDDKPRRRRRKTAMKGDRLLQINGRPLTTFHEASQLLVPGSDLVHLRLAHGRVDGGAAASPRRSQKRRHPHPHSLPDTETHPHSQSASHVVSDQCAPEVMGSNVSRHSGKGLSGRRTQSSGNLCNGNKILAPNVGRFLAPCGGSGGGGGVGGGGGGGVGPKDRNKFCGSLPNHLDVNSDDTPATQACNNNNNNSKDDGGNGVDDDKQSVKNHGNVELRLHALDTAGVYDQGYGSERSPDDGHHHHHHHHHPGIPGEWPQYPFITPDATFPVTLLKGSRGLGLSVTGGTDSHEQWPGLVRIKRVFPQQPAWESGLLCPGDVLLAANGLSLVGLTNYQALEVLRKTPSHVVLTVCRPPSDVCRLQQASEPLPPPPPPPPRRDPAHSMSALPLQPSGELDITLTKVNRSLGFTLRKEDDSALGHYVRALVREPALSDGRIRPGDKIVAVNDVDISPMSHEEAVMFLRQCGDVVRLRLYRDATQTPVSALSPTEDMKVFRPKPLLRKEAMDMLSDLAVRKLSPGHSSSSSYSKLRRVSDGHSSSPCSSPRRRRLTKTPSPDMSTSAGGVDSKHLASDSSEERSSLDSTLDRGETRPTRPNFLDLCGGDMATSSAGPGFVSRKQKFTFTVAPSAGVDEQEEEEEEGDEDWESLASQCCSSEAEEGGGGGGGGGGQASQPASMPPLTTLSSTSSTSTAFSYRNPAYQSAQAGHLQQGMMASKAGDDRASDQDIPGRLFAVASASAAAADGSRGLLKWKGVVFTPDADEADAGRLTSSAVGKCRDEEGRRDQVLMVELTRGWNSRLGFSLQGDGCHTYISAIYADSVAAKDGRLQAGDQVLMVNDENVQEMSTADVIDLLRKIRGTIGITVLRKSGPSPQAS